MSVSTFVEDGGLASLLGKGAQTLARDTALTEPAVLAAVRDVLKAAFSDRPELLDPFAAATERNSEVIRVLRQAIAAQRQRSGVLARVPVDSETLLALFAATLGWGPAQRYLDDSNVNEVKIIGRRIRVQEAGKPFVTVAEAFGSDREVIDRVKMMSSVLGVRLDADKPQATIPLSRGTRMHASIPPRTHDQALVCIRRGREVAWDVSDVLKRDTLSREVADLLLLLCRARCSILIAGRTGSGKTGLLEALANSWPGDGHIISIEDHTSEIGIRRPEWTREMVDAIRDPQVFGQVTREALRQTPDLLLPGEIRGSEAGAILRMVLSDHPVITTLHARTCEEALEQFASCAALPGAYMYESRRDDALRDACGGFDVVIKVDFWEAAGRRVVTDIALCNGSVHEDGAIRPRLVPLVTIDVLPSGDITWMTHAAIGTDGLLQWTQSATDLTPALLREKLVRARSQAAIRGHATTLDAVQEALTRAEHLLLRSEVERALATLRAAWSQRHDDRLLSMAQRTLGQNPACFATLIAEGEAQGAALRRLIEARRWTEANEAWTQIGADLAHAAIAAPVGGWHTIDTEIREGLALHAAAAAACSEAELALGAGQSRVARDVLKPFGDADLPADVALSIVRLREQALRSLLHSGEGAATALETIIARREALEHEIAQAASTRQS
ncbi:MAG TPA: ATPase, T2SS/T4P/T4SS family [Herpetosiphonaceae bacterium]